MMKKKQFYEKPSMKVIEVKLQAQLLNSSPGGTGGSIDSMGNPEEL